MEPENVRAAAPLPGRAALQVILIIFAIAAGAWALYTLERVVLLLAMAMFFACVVAPLVRFVEHPIHHLKQALACIPARGRRLLFTHEDRHGNPLDCSPRLVRARRRRLRILSLARRAPPG